MEPATACRQAAANRRSSLAIHTVRSQPGYLGLPEQSQAVAKSRLSKQLPGSENKQHPRTDDLYGDRWQRCSCMMDVLTAPRDVAAATCIIAMPTRSCSSSFSRFSISACALLSTRKSFAVSLCNSLISLGHMHGLKTSASGHFGASFTPPRHLASSPTQSQLKQEGARVPEAYDFYIIASSWSQYDSWLMHWGMQ